MTDIAERTDVAYRDELLRLTEAGRLDWVRTGRRSVTYETTVGAHRYQVCVLHDPLVVKVTVGDLRHEPVVQVLVYSGPSFALAAVIEKAARPPDTPEIVAAALYALRTIET